MPIPLAAPPRVLAPHLPACDVILTPAALHFLAGLEAAFGERRLELMMMRKRRQARYDAGARPDFLPETAAIRDADWKVAPPPADLRDRRVEITGPVERKLMINALNSGAQAFMADFEDALSPTWRALIEGQQNLLDAVSGRLRHDGPDGTAYRVGSNPATLLVRPRGWHLDEPHVHAAGWPMSASLFDAGLYLFHCSRLLVDKGSGPYLYLPKMESHLEARLWNDVLGYAEARLGLAPGTIRVTVLIETIHAAFEMDEVLYELKDRICGLNAGRWDYLFSLIKTFQGRDDMVLPDRARITMDAPFMQAYTDLLVATCHRRGAHAMGGMAAFVPNRRDPAATENALARVREDKLREARQGFDGTWVAHPDLVSEARLAFDNPLPHRRNTALPTARQDASREALLDLRVPDAHVTPEGLRDNLVVALHYLAAWLDGKGALVVANLMEDTATAEIARAQAWHWVRHRTPFAGGNVATAEQVRAMLDQETERLSVERGADTVRAGHFHEARDLILEVVVAPRLAPFITIHAQPFLEATAAVE